MKQSLPAVSVGGSTLLGVGLLAALFSFLWLALIRQLSVEWSVNPQYNYGWAVPVLCLYLAYRRWSDRPEPLALRVEVLACAAAVVLALLLFPTRLVQEANPDWRLVSWLYAIEVVGLTLVAVRVFFGWRCLAHLAFPICFMLVAVPWPSLLEQPLIQGLTRANALMTVELLNQFGVPALRHGNLIEVSSGVVGIDEACSGIRSLQANLMIALFLGELYRLRLASRLVLVAAGFGMAFLFNVARTVILSAVAAKQGIAAISQWHDPAGVSILVACFVGVWLLALLLGRCKPANSRAAPTHPVAPTAAWLAGLPNLRSARVWIALLLPWVVGVELGTHFWYRSRETSLPNATTWSVHFPSEATAFREIPLSEKTLQYLRYDEAHNAAWRERGIEWQVIFLRWDAGRTAATLARAHTPEICIAAAGREVRPLPGAHEVAIKNLVLPFRSFEVREAGDTIYVFYCLWEDRENGQSAEGAPLSVAKRWQAVLDRRRNLGQRSLEIVIGGVRSLAEADAALRPGLERLLLDR